MTRGDQDKGFSKFRQDPNSLQPRQGRCYCPTPVWTHTTRWSPEKKGPMNRSASLQEYPLIREALGQLLTVQEVSEHDILVVAVPHSRKFAELAQRWRKAPLIMRLGIRILTVLVAGDADYMPPSMAAIQEGWRTEVAYVQRGLSSALNPYVHEFGALRPSDFELEYKGEPLKFRHFH